MSGFDLSSLAAVVLDIALLELPLCLVGESR
jgi:hypothetical protein